MSAQGVPAVAVLIPARNESDSIARCLQHVLSQDLPLDRLEVVIVDGNSDDDTVAVAESVLAQSGVGRWRLHRNPDGSTPSNLNTGLALVRAPVVCRVDARSLIPPDYVRTCAEILERRADVAVVGGAQVAVARSGSTRHRGIARALNNRYGMGLSRYRRGARSGPTDTVYLGAFRTAQLRGIGGWDVRFGTNQDFDLNRRMSSHGIVWFQETLAVGYLPRRSIRALFDQYQRFGVWKVRYWRQTGDRPQRRQWILMCGPLAGLLGLALAMVPRRGRTRRVGAIAAGILVFALAVDEVGSAEHPDRIQERGWAALGSAAVASGWLSGVARGLVSR